MGDVDVVDVDVVDVDGVDVVEVEVFVVEVMRVGGVDADVSRIQKYNPTRPRLLSYGLFCLNKTTM